VLFQIFFSQILKVSLGKVDISLNSDSLVVAVYLHVFSEMAGSACDFDASSEELGKVSGIEDFILNWLGAIDGERVRNLGLSMLFLGNLDFGLFGESRLSLFCGHIKNN
jgi:hypothetical protein